MHRLSMSGVAQRMGKDAAQRKREERARMRAKGYTLRQVWVHPKDWGRVRRYLERVAKAREG